MYVLYVLQGHRDVHAVCVTGASRCTCCVCYRGIVMYVLRVLQGQRDVRAVCVTGASWCTCCVCYRGILMHVLCVLQGHRGVRHADRTPALHHALHGPLQTAEAGAADGEGSYRLPQ